MSPHVSFVTAPRTDFSLVSRCLVGARGRREDCPMSNNAAWELVDAEHALNPAPAGHYAAHAVSPVGRRQGMDYVI